VFDGVQTARVNAGNLPTERNFRRFYWQSTSKEITMYENSTKSTSGQAPRTTSADDTATARRTTDPKFVRESFTMRRMLPWQIAALAIAAAVVVGLIVFYV
jgi:hypothetical protein